MTGRGPRRFSSAHAIAIAALFFALGGGAYAAMSTLPPNSVGTKQLRDHSVTPAKLGAGAGARLTRLEERKIKKIVRKYSRRGPAGPQGPKGEQGEPGPSNLYIAGAAAGSLSPTYSVVASLTVPPGSYLIGAKTSLAGNSSGAAGAGSCEVGNGASPSEIWDGGSASFPALPSTITSASLSLAGAASFEAARTVALLCRTLEGTVSFDDARVWATKVGSIQGLPIPID